MSSELQRDPHSPTEVLADLRAACREVARHLRACGDVRLAEKLERHLVDQRPAPEVGQLVSFLDVGGTKTTVGIVVGVLRMPSDVTVLIEIEELGGSTCVSLSRVEWDRPNAKPSDDANRSAKHVKRTGEFPPLVI